MSQSGDKYKIQIVKTGIGDPFLVVNFQFMDSGIDPEVHPIEKMEVIAYVSTDTDEFHKIGAVVSESISQKGPYRIGIPFDAPEQYSTSETLYVQLEFGANGHAGNFEVEETPGTEGEDVHSSHPYRVTITFNTAGGNTETFTDQIYYSWPN